jgi:EAL domain-containing protein (putative c-di-GMP-specific phosphodiesterase class I)
VLFRSIFAFSAEGLEEARDAPTPHLRRLSERGIRFALRATAGGAFNALNQQDGVPLDLVILQPDEVSQLPDDAQATERLRLALLTAKGMNRPVLATGVNTEAAREWLGVQGCRYLSGELLSAAVSPENLVEWLKDRPQQAA